MTVTDMQQPFGGTTLAAPVVDATHACLDRPGGVVVSEGLEPPTPALGKRRSVQLSYETVRAL